VVAAAAPDAAVHGEEAGAAMAMSRCTSIMPDFANPIMPDDTLGGDAAPQAGSHLKRAAHWPAKIFMFVLTTAP
jgi:hypothetical protein